jgi:hypothetical protein
MTIPQRERKTLPLGRGAGCLGVIGFLAVVFVLVVWQHRESTLRYMETQRAERRQSSFERVKNGESSVLVTDSKLLPMLANDSECKKIATELVFASLIIDPEDASHIGQLQNVSSLGFYCTEGTREVLIAAKLLPITRIYFEIPHLADEDYFLLTNFPKLEKVHFEQVMADDLIQRLKSEMPNVIIDATHLRSQEPGLAK